MKSFWEEFLSLKKSSVFGGSSKLACGPIFAENHYAAEYPPTFAKNTNNSKHKSDSLNEVQTTLESTSDPYQTHSTSLWNFFREVG